MPKIDVDAIDKNHPFDKNPHAFMQAIINNIAKANNLKPVEIVGTISSKNFGAIYSPFSQTITFSGNPLEYDKYEMSYILAHEMVHPTQSNIFRYGSLLVSGALLITSAIKQSPRWFAGGIAAALLCLYHARNQELEADEKGIKLLGLGKKVAISALNKASRANPPSTTPTILSNHPEIDDRISNIQTKFSE